MKAAITGTDVAPPTGELVFATRANRSRLSRQAQAGNALRLAPGVYVVGSTLPPEQVAHHHRLDIIGHVWPGAVIMGRSALSGAMPVDGWLHIAHPDPPRAAPLTLPGVTVGVEIGPSALPGDMPMPASLALSGDARRLVENIDVRGRRARSRAGTVAVEDYIDELARSGGRGRIQRVLNELDVISGAFDPRRVQAARARLIAVLGTRTDGVRSARLAARLSGNPYDRRRLDRLEDVLGVLSSSAPHDRAAGGPPERWEWLSFFEAYFSNFIEGTEFGVEEARRIAVDRVTPNERPADAHDVAATYRLARDPEDSARVPATSDELLQLLLHRHAVLMAARPDKHPGQFKTRENYAGGYQFVEHDLVIGTLQQGFERLAHVVDPMARAVAMMVLVTECHPFDDGNGRVARLMANAELSHAGQVRIVIPTSLRNNYIAALSAISNGMGDGQSLVAVLDFAQRWTASIDWRSFDRAHDQIEESNGYVDPAVAESSGRRLHLPT